MLEIHDKEPSVPEDLAAKIFVPFFTARKRGSGISPSLRTLSPFPQCVDRIGARDFERMPAHSQARDEQCRQSGPDEKRWTKIDPVGKLVKVLSCPYQASGQANKMASNTGLESRQSKSEMMVGMCRYVIPYGTV